MNAIDKHRENGSAYVDLEAQLTDKFLAGVAGRVEDYSDFGWTGNGKLSLRYDFTPNFALRGTASTGFRAPALQQQYLHLGRLGDHQWRTDPDRHLSVGLVGRHDPGREAA